MKKIIRTAALVILLGGVYAQNVRGQITNAPEQDCINAIPICVGTYYQERYYEGSGTTPGEIHPASCLRSNEKNGTWYSFTVEGSGT